MLKIMLKMFVFLNHQEHKHDDCALILMAGSHTC